MAKKHLILLLVAVMVLSTITGCQPQSETPVGADEGSEKTDLVIAIKADVNTLHPTDHRTTAEMDIVTQIYDTFTKKARNKDPEPRPHHYESVRTGRLHVPPPERCYVPRRYACESERRCVSAKLYQESIYQNAMVAGMESVEALDEYTVVFKTSTVYAPFLQSIMGLHVASEAYYNSVDADTFANRPIGSGPYKFVDREVGSKILLEAHEDYYLGAPPIKNVTYRVIPDDTTIAVGLQTGEIDFAAIAPSIYATLKGQKGVEIDEYPMSRFGFISVSHEKYPYNQTKFRQASPMPSTGRRWLT